MPAGNAQPQRDPRDLKAQWRAKLMASRHRYFELAGQCSRLSDAVKDRAVPYPDGAFALSRARRAASTALSEYRRLEKEYAELVVSGTIPEPYDDEVL